MRSPERLFDLVLGARWQKSQELIFERCVTFCDSNNVEKNKQQKNAHTHK